MTLPSEISVIDDCLLTASKNRRTATECRLGHFVGMCDSASGSGAGSSVYGGRASVFVQARTRALWVSYRPARDDAAIQHTVHTLRGERSGLARATALQRPMLRLMRDPKVLGAANPAVWAPFVLIKC